LFRDAFAAKKVDLPQFFLGNLCLKLRFLQSRRPTKELRDPPVEKHWCKAVVLNVESTAAHQRLEQTF